MNWVEFAIARKTGQLLRTAEQRSLTEKEVQLLEMIDPVLRRLEARESAPERTAGSSRPAG
jgi:hypothetical protein